MARVVCLFLLATAVFLFGAIASTHIFDARGAATDSVKPWVGKTRQHLRIPSALPPGLKPHPEHDVAGPGTGSGTTGGSGSGNAASSPAPPLPPVVAPPVPQTEPKSSADGLSLAEVAVKGPASWGDFNGRGLEFRGSLDSPQLSFGAWVYLDSRDRSPVIKMIASNRHGGCARDDAHRGWSFYINNWQMEDRALVLEWRNARDAADGCARLSSDAGTIPYDTWVHVGFALAAGGEAAGGQQALLFLNGELLRAASVSRSAEDVQGDSVHLWLGGSPDKQYSFNGAQRRAPKNSRRLQHQHTTTVVPPNTHPPL